MDKDFKQFVIGVAVFGLVGLFAVGIERKLAEQPKPVTSQAVQTTDSAWQPEVQNAPVYGTDTGNIAEPTDDFSSVDSLLALHNQLRMEQSVGSLVADSRLSNSASMKCNDMQVNNYWAHDNPNGNYKWISWFDKAGAAYVQGGENIYRNGASTNNMLAVMTAWWNSPTHKENMLKSKWVRMGQADCYGQQGQIIVVHFAY